MTYNNNLLDPDEFSTDSDYLQEINLDLIVIFDQYRSSWCSRG